MSQKYMWVANKQMKMQIKATLIYYFKVQEWVKFKRWTILMSPFNWRNRASVHWCCEYKMVQLVWKIVWLFLITFNIIYPVTAFLPLDIDPREMKHMSTKELYREAYGNFICNPQCPWNWNTPKSIYRRVDKLTLVYLYKGILLRNTFKKETNNPVIQAATWMDFSMNQSCKRSQTQKTCNV